MTFCFVRDFCEYLLRDTSNLTIFYGLFFKINFCNLCSVMNIP